MRFWAVLLLCVGVLLPSVVWGYDRASAVIIGVDEHVVGNVATVGDDIEVAGVVEGDVTSWSGTIIISGQVQGDVVSYGGRVLIRATARVSGHVMALSGGLVRDDGALIAGQVIGSADGVGALASVFDLFSTTPFVSNGVDGVGRLLVGGAFGVVVFAFCLLCLVFWPRRLFMAGVVLMRLPLRACVLGLLTTGLLGLIMPPVVILLAATLIGFPLLPVLLVVVHIPYISGFAVLARWLGTWLMRGGDGDGWGLVGQRTGRVLDPAVVASAAFLVSVLLVGGLFAPLWGAVLFYVVASPGLGAVVLSRGGLYAPLPYDGAVSSAS